jgi:phage recombination protein Bet
MTESKALTTTEAAPPQGYSRDQIDLIKRTVAAGASDDELRLFLYQAQRTGLDPLSRQIYCIMRYADGKPRATIQTGIDGYRLAADRTGLYAGNDDYVFDEGTTEYGCVQDGRKQPVTATACVWKIVQGQRVSFRATARWDEYYPGDKGGTMWRKMPFLMLGKCAEALALRKAFPAELSGLYTDDEMAQAGPTVEAEYREVAPPAPPKPAPKPTEARAQHTR